LQRDKRVVVMDKVNARYLKPGDLTETADVVTIDASFISLTKLLPAANALLKIRGHIVALIKPQFEAGREHVEKGGVVKDETAREAAVGKVAAFGQKTLGLQLVGITESPLLGPAGNKEFLVCFRKVTTERA
jgi:23S rRNA (cytidine1920-2'-O)/16S rRNA (cytidine1409-2'-O)-methyltransferase